MKEITIYETEDGTRFDNKSKAERYETLATNLNAVALKYLGVRTKKCDNGAEALSHTIKDVQNYKKEICLLAAEYIPSFAKTFEECGDGTRHISHAERIVSDYNVKALDYAFFRLCCINEVTGDEYSQPYYAIHPEEWKKDYEKYYKDKK